MSLNPPLGRETLVCETQTLTAQRGQYAAYIMHLHNGPKASLPLSGGEPIMAQVPSGGWCFQGASWVIIGSESIHNTDMQTPIIEAHEMTSDNNAGGSHAHTPSSAMIDTDTLYLIHERLQPWYNNNSPPFPCWVLNRWRERRFLISTGFPSPKTAPMIQMLYTEERVYSKHGNISHNQQPSKSYYFKVPLLSSMAAWRPSRNGMW